MRERGSGRELGLGWAIVAALVVHALALVASLVLPVFEFVSAAPPPEDRITFTLAEPERLSPDAAESAPPAPSMPAPVVPPPAPEPSPRPEPAPESPRRIEEPAPPPPRDAAVTVPDAAPQAESADLGSGASSEPADARPRPGSLRGALRDFRSAVRDAPRPPPSADPAPPSRPSNVFVPDMSQVPVTGSQLGELTFESRDYDWSEYGRQIYMAIWRAWHRRLHASSDEFERWAHETGEWYIERQSGVRFTIERSGLVVGIEIEYPGGCRPLDVSAADALAEVVLPPLPEDFPRDREVVHARFVVRGEVRAMRPVLRRMKAMGLF